MRESYFIASCGTGIGKTLVTASLCWQLRAQGVAVEVIKPVITGFSALDKDSDTALILRSLGEDASRASVERVSPWRFAAPLAPCMAARREGRSVALEDVAAYCRRRARAARGMFLVEGAGGVMTPLNAAHTMLDVMQSIDFPVVFVTGSYLGSISHALTALAVLAARDIRVASIVVSESAGSAVPLEETVETLKHFTKAIPVLSLPRLPGEHDPWRAVPSLLDALA